jgi:hypothetical protein
MNPFNSRDQHQLRRLVARFFWRRKFLDGLGRRLQRSNAWVASLTPPFPPNPSAPRYPETSVLPETIFSAPHALRRKLPLLARKSVTV